MYQSHNLDRQFSIEGLEHLSENRRNKDGGHNDFSTSLIHVLLTIFGNSDIINIGESDNFPSYPSGISTLIYFIILIK